MNSIQFVTEVERNDYVTDRMTDHIRTTGGFPRSTTSEKIRFRYGYICRLIDDSELQDLPKDLRSQTRERHKAFYWKSLSLLRRDAVRVLKLRREKMSAIGAWDFQTLVNDHARIQLLLAKLTLAGITHSVRLGAGLDSARQACLEFESFLASSSITSSSAARALTA
jgi:hypothetical protein